MALGAESSDSLSGVLAERRRRFFEEMDRDPALRAYVRGLAAAENGGHPEGIVERLVNGADMNGRASLWDEIRSGFYGPVNRGTVQPMASSPDYDAALDRVRAGSNDIGLLTDQGMRNEHRPAARIGVEPTLIRGEWYSPMGPRGLEWKAGVERSAAERAAAVSQGPNGLDDPGARDTLALLPRSLLATAGSDAGGRQAETVAAAGPVSAPDTGSAPAVSRPEPAPMAGYEPAASLPSSSGDPVERALRLANGLGNASTVPTPMVLHPAHIGANPGALRLAQSAGLYGLGSTAGMATGGAVDDASGDGFPALDTGDNLPETLPSLLGQQEQLIEGRRPAQMFPAGTPELPVPDGMERLATSRGAYHFNPAKVTARDVAAASAKGRENDILGLGPLSKDDVKAEMRRTGEPPVVVVERDAMGNEIKAALATPGTAHLQALEIAGAMAPDHVLSIEPVRDVLAGRMPEINGDPSMSHADRALRRLRADGGAVDLVPDNEGTYVPNPDLDRSKGILAKAEINPRGRDWERPFDPLRDETASITAGREAPLVTAVGAALADQGAPRAARAVDRTLDVLSLPGRVASDVALYPVHAGRSIGSAIADPTPAKVGEAALDAGLLPIMLVPGAGEAASGVRSVARRALDAASGRTVQRAGLATGIGGGALAGGSTAARADTTWSDVGDTLKSLPGRVVDWWRGTPEDKDSRPTAPAVDEPYTVSQQQDFKADWMARNPRRTVDMEDVTRQAQDAFRASGAYKTLMQGRDDGTIGPKLRQQVAEAEQRFVADYLGRLTPAESPEDYERRATTAWDAYRRGVDEATALHRAERAYASMIQGRGLGETPFEQTWWGRNVNPSMTPYIVGAVSGAVPAVARGIGERMVTGRWQKAIDQSRASAVPSERVEAATRAKSYDDMMTARRADPVAGYKLPVALGASEGVAATYLPTVWNRSLPEDSVDHRAAAAALAELPPGHPERPRFESLLESTRTNAPRQAAINTDLSSLGPEAAIRSLGGAGAAGAGTKLGGLAGPSAMRVEELRALGRTPPLDPRAVEAEAARLIDVRRADGDLRRSHALSDAADQLEQKALVRLQEGPVPKALTASTKEAMASRWEPKSPSSAPSLPSPPSPASAASQPSLPPPSPTTDKGGTRPIQGGRTGAADRALETARSEPRSSSAASAPKRGRGDVDAPELNLLLDRFVGKARDLDPTWLSQTRLDDAVKMVLRQALRREPTAEEITRHMPAARDWYTTSFARSRSTPPARASGGKVGAADRALALAAGGSVQRLATGPLMGPTGGRSDHLPISVPAGSHVIPADVVSGLGEGNTHAGMLALDKLFNAGPYGMALKGGKRRRAAGGEVPILASDGEYVIDPEVVAAMGGGDVQRGHDALDRWIVDRRRNIIATMANLPGPAKD